MKLLILLLSLGLICAQHELAEGPIELPEQSEWSHHGWDNLIIPLLDTPSRMALGQTSKSFRSITHELNRISDALLATKRLSCGKGMQLEALNTAFTLFKENFRRKLGENATMIMRNQITCLEGLVPKVDQFDGVFDILYILLPDIRASDEIKLLGNEYFTLLERLFRHKNHFKSITIDILSDGGLKFLTTLEPQTEERLFKLLSGPSIDHLTLYITVDSAQNFSQFAQQSDVQKFTFQHSEFVTVHDFNNLKSLNILPSMDSGEFRNIIESSPNLQRLAINGDMIEDIKKSDGIKGIKIVRCNNELSNLSERFESLQTLIIGSNCILHLHTLDDILTSHKDSIVELSYASSFTSPYAVLLSLQA